MKTARISLWSGPRNVSTALMYSFAQRKDTTVVDEPLYAYYLTRSGAQHPGREAVLQAQCADGSSVISNILLGSYPTPVVFFKQMAHHLPGLEDSFLDRMHNVLLIRDPASIILSYSKVIPNPTLNDLGFPQLIAMFEALKQGNKLAAVIDSRQLLLNPRHILRSLCRQVNLEFDEGMLHWTPGKRIEDGVWAPYWYDSVHRSSGFAPYKPREQALPDCYADLLAEAQPLYDRLYEHALKVPGS